MPSCRPSPNFDHCRLSLHYFGVLDRLQDEEEQHETLLYHTIVMLDEGGVIVEESTVVCFDFSFCQCGPILMPLLHSSKYQVHTFSFAAYCGQKVGRCWAVGEICWY